MRSIFTAPIVAAALAAGTAGSLGAGLIDVTGAIVDGTAGDVPPAYVAAPGPGYIVYSGYAAALPGPNCYWTRMPVYDSDHSVIGWRGRPVAVCPQKRLSAEAGK